MSDPEYARQHHQCEVVDSNSLAEMDDDNSYTKQGDAFACPLTLDTVSEPTVFCRAPPLALGLTIGDLTTNQLSDRAMALLAANGGTLEGITSFENFRLLLATATDIAWQNLSADGSFKMAFEGQNACDYGDNDFQVFDEDRECI